MTFGIQTLPTEVVHLIAAGEVIDSLAAVVRELVENAIDAGATRIVISVWANQWRVRVADNGCGMKLEDLLQAATAHSTSKIRNCEDLWQINSLGFRGEALHSLAQLADLEVLSRWQTTDEAWRVTYCPQGEPAEIDTVAIAPGTVVTVDNLFGTWWERREGLPALAQQMKAIQTTIGQIALCHPQVTWVVWLDDRQWFTLSPGVSTQQLLPQIVRQLRVGDLQQLKVELPQLGEEKQGLLQLVLGLPDRCHRHRPDWVKVAVNGRMVKLPEIEQTILSATAKTLPRDRYPVCFLHLKISPNQVNWNRHPAKTEIYLHNLSHWQEQVSQAIEQILRLNSDSVCEQVHNTRVGKVIKAAEAQGTYGVKLAPQIEASFSLKAVSQVHNTYIMVEHPGGLWLVEQHIAHERVLYDQLLTNWQLVKLETPAILNNLSTIQTLQLERIGLEVEPFGEDVWAIRSAPALLAEREDCAEALLELSLGGDLQTAQVAVACRSAIRNGTPLSLEQMQTLIDQWQRTRNPRTCPHGRPIYLSLEETALSRFFRRHWVIGKSHGI
ncbi:MAG: DNA mismatch repair endonuclease MutL [Chroococcus sp. CMT-3BRIN-NPC107]|jgi:DNA mismatch repair protein MutL|nr:DNA mismatch repair endonuclease MutL [Chroococcus sp. CMT-3BRIN-NPC107]